MRRGAVLALALVAACDTAPRLLDPPPPGYAGDIYIDGAGCAWARTAADGWAPRVSRDRDQLCGIRPTADPASASAAPARPSPEATPPVVPPGIAAPTLTPPGAPTVAPAPPTADAAPPPAASAPSGFLVQVGAFARPANATALVATLRAEGYRAQAIALTSDLTAVVVGPFGSGREADRVRRDLVAAGYAGALVMR